MSKLSENLAELRILITNTCMLLQDAQHRTPAFGRAAYVSNADCYVLLKDTTKLYCHALSEAYGEADSSKRWSPALPELLLAHPDKCEQTLSLLEREDFRELSYFQFVEA
jgi:hypothetical protein